MNKYLVFKFLVLLSIINTQAQDTTRVSLLFGGDVMGHDSQISAAYDATKKAYDYDPCFQFVKELVSSPDLTIANLEVTLAGPPYKGYPQFSSPDALAVTLKNSGFDLLVTANNHCVDRGKKGLDRTISRLDSLEIPHTGTFVDTISRVSLSPLMIRKNGFNLALLNYSYGTNGLPIPKLSIVNLIDTALIRKDVEYAKTLNPDAIIVFTHWGTEYESLPSAWQKRLTDFCFNLGVKLVIGSHPHVIQPMEWRKETDQFVAYSLGNFVSGQRKRYTDGGAMAYIELEKISYHPDSAVTTIVNAEYYLQYVYKASDASKDYYVIPVLPSATVARAFVKDTVSVEAMRIFVEDSRSLFSKHNKEVLERAYLPAKYEKVTLEVR
ncbi:MAG: CapA family protein [Chryseolinea sp.]